MQPKDKSIVANGVSLHYLDWGNSGSTPMLLLHGLCSNAHYWDFFAQSMKQSYHVLALDQRGTVTVAGPKTMVPRTISLISKLSLLS